MDIAELKIGQHVRTRTEFSGVPVGTMGELVEASNSWPDNDSVAVAWKRYEGDTLIDWFSFSDLQYLEAV